MSETKKILDRLELYTDYQGIVDWHGRDVHMWDAEIYDGDTVTWSGPWHQGNNERDPELDHVLWALVQDALCIEQYDDAVKMHVEHGMSIESQSDYDTALETWAACEHINNCLNKAGIDLWEAAEILE